MNTQSSVEIDAPSGCLVRLTTGDARSCSTRSSMRLPRAGSVRGRSARSPRRWVRATECSSIISGRAMSCCSRSSRRSSAVRRQPSPSFPMTRPTPSPRCGLTSAGPSCARSSGCSSSVTPGRPRARHGSRAWYRGRPEFGLSAAPPPMASVLRTREPVDARAHPAHRERHVEVRLVVRLQLEGREEGDCLLVRHVSGTLG
jgi:hypothetical protein